MESKKYLRDGKIKEALLALARDGKILDASLAVEHVSGHKTEELSGRSLSEWFSDPGEGKHVLKAIEECIAQDMVITVEFRFRHKHQKDFLAEMILMPWRAGGEFRQGCHGLLRNVIQQREADQALAEAQALRKQFTATVSHELRTPLFVLKEIVSMLLADEGKTLTAQQTRFLDMAQSNVERLEKLILETLDLKALEQGRKTLHFRENSVEEIFQEILSLKKKDAEKKGLRLISETGLGVPRINFDREQILDCFRVLLDFAIRSAGGGDITLKAVLENNMVRISIHIPTQENPCDDISRIFLRFEPLNEAEKCKLGRTGVEFARIREIIEQHNGKIWSYYFSGQGACFQILLPVWERRSH
jgi:PAS domain S-box-containing protein